MQKKSLTLGQQRICRLSPAKIGISPESLATVVLDRAVARAEQEPQDRSPVATRHCPFAPHCKCIGDIRCAAVKSLGGNFTYNAEGDLLPIQHVICLLPLDLEEIRSPVPIVREIQSALGQFGLECNPKVEWVPQRVLTVRMQQLLKCGLTEIGISIKVADELEDCAEITTLEELLATDWHVLQGFARPERDGGIPNFGPMALKEIREKLAEAGFAAPPGTKWVREQDTKEFQEQEMKKFFPMDADKIKLRSAFDPE